MAFHVFQTNVQPGARQGCARCVEGEDLTGRQLQD